MIIIIIIIIMTIIIIITIKSHFSDLWIMCKKANHELCHADLSILV